MSDAILRAMKVLQGPLAHINGVANRNAVAMAICHEIDEALSLCRARHPCPSAAAS